MYTFNLDIKYKIMPDQPYIAKSSMHAKYARQ